METDVQVFDINEPPPLSAEAIAHRDETGHRVAAHYVGISPLTGWRCLECKEPDPHA